jgi:hypothetical protein
MEVSLNYTSKTYANHMISVSRPRLRIHKKMAYWNVYIESLDRCYAQLKLIWPIQLPPMTLMSFLTMQHGKFALPITRAAIFGRDMLFGIRFMTDWHKIEEHRQSLTDHGNQHKNPKCIVYDYKVGDKILVINEGILPKAESKYGKDPMTITPVHMNGTNTIQHGTRME